MHRNLPQARSGNGFTLIELLIVVAIIAILAAIAVPNFLEAQTRAKVSRARADLRTVLTALETYRIDNRAYPRPVDAFFDTGSYYIYDERLHERVPSTLTTPISYLNSIPMDPFNPEAEARAALHPYKGRLLYANIDYFLIATPGNTQYIRAKEAAGSFVTAGNGPDRNKYNNPPGRAAVTRGQWIDYDSTNGTLSRGNIIRTQKDPEKFGVHDWVMNAY